MERVDDPIKGGPIAIGHPIPNTAAHVVDGNGQKLPVGCLGEIVIAGRCVARGYRHQPGLTRRRFGDPSDEQRTYRTGDRGRRLADGRLVFAGRADDEIKYHGHRIDPDEIAQAMQDAFGIRRCLILKRTYDKSEATREALVAYYIAPRALAVYTLKAGLADYLVRGVIPSHFVWLKRFPLTLTGKVNLARLPDSEGIADRTVPYRAPADEVERELTTIWEALFELDRVGVDDHFFDLGGHSLRAVQLISRIHDALGVEIGLADVFTAPTVAGIAALVRTHPRAGREASVVPAPRQGSPLAMGQQRMWLGTQRPGGEAAYTIAADFELPRGVDAHALEAALSAVAERHEALRAGFVVDQGRPLMVVHAEAPLVLERVDLRDAPDPAAEARRLARDARQLVFDLAAPPLLRVQLASLGGGRNVLIFAVHHLVADGWSLARLIAEVSEDYEARIAGRTPTPQANVPSYRDFVARQRALVASPGFEAYARQWRDRVSVGTLSAWALRDPEPRASAADAGPPQVRLELDAAELSRVAAGAASWRMGVLDLLLAAVSGVYAARHSPAPFVLNLATAGRYRREYEAIVGMLVNIVPVALGADPDASFRANAVAVQRALLEAVEHQQYPFEELVARVPELRSLADGLALSSTLNIDGLVPRLAGEPLRPFTRLGSHAAQARAPVTLVLERSGDGAAFYGVFMPRVYAAETVARFLEASVELLRRGLAHPDRPIEELVD